MHKAGKQFNAQAIDESDWRDLIDHDFGPEPSIAGCVEFEPGDLSLGMTEEPFDPREHVGEMPESLMIIDAEMELESLQAANPAFKLS